MKIAMISSNSHEKIGGTEKYARLIFDSFSDKHDFTEYPIMREGKKITNRNNKVLVNDLLIGLPPDDLIWFGTYKNSHLKKIYEENDLVILNNLFPPRKYLSHKKTILIQHMDIKFYGFKGKPFWLGIGSFLAWSLFGVSGTIGNPFKKATRRVMFTADHSFKKTDKEFYIPLPSDLNYKDFVRSGWSWLGRLDNPQKNIDDLVYVANNISNFEIYGQGKDKKQLKKLIDQSKYKGFLESKNLKAYLASKEGIILTSNWEGFPFIIVEALHAGCKVISYDTFLSTNYFLQSKNFAVVPNKYEMVNLIKSNNLKNSKTFAKENLTKDKFVNAWKKIFKQFEEEDKNEI